MARITRPRMARGTKLVKEHIEQSVGAVAADLSNANVQRENMASQYAPRRIVFHVPLLDSNYFVNAANGRTLFAVPITFPPFQQQWDDDGRVRDTVPVGAILSSFSMSWDTAQEPASICDRYQGGVETNTQKRNENGTGAYAMAVALNEKRQLHFDANAGKVCDVNLFQATLSAEAVSGRDFRFNPFYIGDLNKELRPYRTYLLTIDARHLYDSATGYCSALCSLVIEFEVLVRLVARDGLSDTVQNIPTRYAAKTPRTVAQTAIAGNDPITEAKVQGNIVAVDDVFLDKLEGGSTQEGIAPPTESVLDDSAWHCMVVPLWQNCGARNMLTAQWIGYAPYFTDITPYKTPTCDRRRVPIVYPWVLHHAILAENRMAPKGDGMGTAGTDPTSAHLVKHVGIGVAQDAHNDDTALQTIAELSYSPNGGGFIDEVDVCANAQHLGWRLWSVPIKGAGGKGYAAQGHPIFVGKTTMDGSARSTIGGGASQTLGRETMLEVRMEMVNATDGLAAAGGVELDNAVYAGTGGHFVLLFGKSPLVGNLQDLQV